MYSEDLNISRFAHEDSEKLNPLAIAILRASDSSPFFVREPGCGQLEPTDALLFTWWHYLDMIAMGTSSDANTSFCLAALQSLWAYSPYNQSYELIYLPDPEDWAPDLMRAAIAGKLWLAGDDRESKRCLHMLYCSIRDALVYASPYHPFPPNHYSRRRRKYKNTYRTKTIDAIAEMLRYERDISMCKERPSLTDCAITWRCLDIWKLALEKAGCQLLSSAIWNDYCHFYDSLGFVSCESGTSVSLTGDSISQKVILVVGERQYADVDPDECSWRKKYPRTLEFKELTQGWQCALNLPQVHCEVYPLHTVDTEVVDGETNQLPHSDGAHSTSKYTLQPMEDGGIELFIDCCEVGEPEERIWAEVRREQEQDADESKNDPAMSGDECIDSDDSGEESNSAFPGAFSKIAGFGLDVMSAFV